jgi:tRNA-splicing ligase RtcB (3'-phosphate/5'-hydroxy nucleic acid ligase)
MIKGTHDQQTLDQFKLCMSTGSAAYGALCADGHFGYNHPIGGVVGYRDHISISGVGFDIACGNKAVKLSVKKSELGDISSLLKQIQSVVSFGVGRVNEERVDHELFESELWDQADVTSLKPLAQSQLGTVGSGNHYIDLFVDDRDHVWIGVHFGSRGLGHKITKKYLQLAGDKNTMSNPPCLLEAESDLGRAYWAGLQLGGLYAYAGRDWVVEKVRSIVGGEVLWEVHNNHNFCWKEEHFGEQLYVVRKGATPAFPGQHCFVGGSMTSPALILQGVKSEENTALLSSTVHGAGRIMSRSQAKGKFDRKTGEMKRAPGIDKKAWEQQLQDAEVTLLGAGLDEAPDAYRDILDVFREHAASVSIERVLFPFGVIMAGENELDPYKD